MAKEHEMRKEGHEGKKAEGMSKKHKMGKAEHMKKSECKGMKK